MDILVLIRSCMPLRSKTAEHSIQNVIFDLDGTLIHSAPSILSCFDQATQKLGCALKTPLHSGLIGPPLLETLSLLTGETNVEALNKLAYEFKSIYDLTGYKQSIPYEGVGDLLELLCSNGIALYIVTNKRYIPTFKIIEYFGWNKLFKGIYAIDSYPDKASNKTQVLQCMLDDLQLNHTSCYYIGDTHKDYQAANMNTLKFIFVGWGYGAPEANFYYDGFAQKVSDLRNLIIH